MKFFACILFFSIVAVSCNNPSDVSSNTAAGKNDTLTKRDTLTPEQQHMAENALKGLTITEGLQVKAFATEPMLKNPTNIDVDERGRVWVTEAYNYRPAINNNPVNPAGDRIMILEDTNGDGKADTAKIFYQGPEINAPLGICVLGNKVIISQSPYVWIFHDDNGDDKADRKEILFQGIEGEQHDHGVHAFTFAADGKLYFNFGNAGVTIKDKNGKDIRDQDGDIIGPKKYKQGIVFRCDTNGTHVEVLAHNFRNPYEVAVDSYGGLWQSDNDDDGNFGVRINYVMEYGNYGFTDEITGAGWQENRTNIEDSIPLRHWHQNDPGSIPNLLQTGAGSPTGMVIYEGKLLPKYYGQIIHSDAGPNVVRSYPVKKNGAGFTAQIDNILKGERDQWFRPADVCVAPDGSLFIADWYDPGVGGHAAGDQTRGRIYRVAPLDSKYIIPQQDYTSPAGAIAALQNPNLSVRYHAYNVLTSMGDSAITELKKLWNSNADSRMRARAFWLLVKMPNTNPSEYIKQAIKENDPDLRILGIRAASELNANLIGVITELINDPDEHVKRQCALSLHHNKSREAAELWATLASKYNGDDRWYLEALGIGADRQWDKFLSAYLAKVGDSVQTEASKEIVWRARTDKAVPFIAKLASDDNVALHDRLRYFRAFDFNSGPLKYSLLLKMIKDTGESDLAFNKLILQHLDNKTVMGSVLAQKTLKNVLQSIPPTNEYIELVARYKVKSENKNLLQLALDSSDKSIGKNAAGLLLQLGGKNLAQSVINGKDTTQQYNLLAALGNIGSIESINLLQSTALSKKYNIELRKRAARRIGSSYSGEDRVVALLRGKKVAKELIPDLVDGVHYAWRGSVRTEAQSYLPESEKSAAGKKAPDLKSILALSPDADAGAKVFTNICSVCHKVNNLGNDFGPNLSAIGSKLPKEGLYESIVNPSEGIGFGYENWELKMKDGSTVSGIIASKTKTDVDIKFAGGSSKQIKRSDISSMKQLKESAMPENLYANMSAQDMANLLEYLKGLKKN